jgi:hypothetical protein
MRKKLKLSYDSSNTANKKYKRGCVVACGGVWLSLRLAGVWSQAIGFVVVRLTEI